MRTTSIRRAAVPGIAVLALALTACGPSSTDSGSEGGSGDSSAAASSENLSGELAIGGASSQESAQNAWIVGFGEVAPDVTVTYDPVGSGGGRENFISGAYPMAGSDSYLTDDEGELSDATERCNGQPPIEIPNYVSPIAIIYNLDGVDNLQLSPKTLAGIFAGKITKWNDPKIAAVNKGTTLPNVDIKVFFRSDESGTTENFTKYLAASAKENWTAEPAKKWSGKGEGKAKTAGVTNAVKSTPGGITYAEWSSAKDNQLGMAQVDNGAGPVALTGESAGKAVAAATQDGSGNNLKLKLDYATKEAGAYPIILVTYEIVCSKYSDPEIGKGVKAFLNHFGSSETQKSLEEVGYAPLPSEIQGKVETAVNAIQ